MDEQAVLNQVAIAFQYTYLHDDWVCPLDEALGGLSFEGALRRPREGMKCIWEIVLHLAIWNENIVARVRTGEKSRPVEGAWPALPDVPDEAAWQGAQKRLWDALKSVQEMLGSTTMAQIEASPYGLADVLCRFTHNGYHIGQIVKMRQLAGETD